VKQYPDVRIYAVWINMRPTDERSAIDVGAVPGGQHFWDPEREVGLWLGDNDVGGLGYAGIVWDAFFLYGKDATWDDVAKPVASGAPVVSYEDELAAALERQ
jgi:hypothetical protein